MPNCFGPRDPARCSPLTEPFHVQASRRSESLPVDDGRALGPPLQTFHGNDGYTKQNLRGATACMQTALPVVQEFVHCLGVVPRGMCNQGSWTGRGKRERLALTGPGMQVSDRTCFRDHLTCNGYLCSRRLWCLQVTR